MHQGKIISRRPDARDLRSSAHHSIFEIILREIQH
jgi:hypothetical protein